MSTRRTLAREIKTEGTALHAGGTVHMTLSPAASGSGIVFRRSDKANAEVAARYDAVTETNLGTVIGSGEVKIGVIEHLMAAVAGAGIDDLLVTLDGPEPPILDGDALSYLSLARTGGDPGTARRQARDQGDAPGRGRDQGSPHPPDAPSDAPEYSYELDYSNTKAIGKQSYAMTLTRENFRARDRAGPHLRLHA